MKRSILIIFFIALAGMTVLPILAAIPAISQEPAVAKGPDLSFDKIKRVKQLVNRHKPRFMRYRQTRRVNISEVDLNLILDYGIAQGLQTDRIHADIHLVDKQAVIDVSVRIPDTPLGKYANISMGFSHDGRQPVLSFIQAGRLILPGGLITKLIPIAGRYFLPGEIYPRLEESLQGIRSLSTKNDTLSLTYDWNPKTLLKLHEDGKSILIPRTHQEKLVDYTNRITQILTLLETHQVNTISLTRILRPLFRYGAEQSKKSNDPVLENTALLQALTFYTLNGDLSHLVNADLMKDIPTRRRARLTLRGRSDLAKHFLVSAGIAVSAGSRLSHFAGLLKEVEDAGRGSGFSFADLAADRAGVRLGELAAGSSNTAQHILTQMAVVKAEGDFMPKITRLPEGIMELEFKKRYNDLDSRAYGMIDNEIDRRLARCRIFRTANKIE